MYSEHIFDIYKARAVYPLPNTPKIMLPDKQVSKKFMRLWVQRAPHKLDKLLNAYSP